MLNDCVLILADSDRLVIETAGAGLLAESGTDAGCEFREAVGQREPLISFPVETLVKQVVPVRAEIVERASGNHAVQRFAVLAERDAAIHAARGLLAARSLVKRGVKLAVCLNSLERSGRRIAFSFIVHKSCRFTHMPLPPCVLVESLDSGFFSRQSVVLEF